jgi:hypothetical protein
MKIFVSYSRSDAGDFADQIQKHLGIFGQYNVFTDERSIGIGEVWSHTIETNISDCDIFVAIITHGALQSPHVEKEVLQAQTEKKKIVPCFHRYVRKEDIKWGLSKIQGFEFIDKYGLARDLYSKIAQIRRDSQKKASNNFSSSDLLETKGGGSTEEDAILPKKEPGKRRWTDPVILVPIIVAAVAAIVGPLVVPMVQEYVRQEQPAELTSVPTPEPPPESTPIPPEFTQTPTSGPAAQHNSLTFKTDKKSYGFGDYVNISGTVAQPVKGNPVRLDVYDPDGNTFTEIVMPTLGDPMPSDKPQSNVQISPNADGFFNHTFRLSTALPEYAIKGNYTVEGTYQGKSGTTWFILR